MCAYPDNGVTGRSPALPKQVGLKFVNHRQMLVNNAETAIRIDDENLRCTTMDDVFFARFLDADLCTAGMELEGVGGDCRRFSEQNNIHGTGLSSQSGLRMKIFALAPDRRKASGFGPGTGGSEYGRFVRVEIFQGLYRFGRKGAPKPGHFSLNLLDAHRCSQHTHYATPKRGAKQPSILSVLDNEPAQPLL